MLKLMLKYNPMERLTFKDFYSIDICNTLDFSTLFLSAYFFQKRDPKDRINLKNGI